jgi:hypothetical protein
MKVAIIGGRDHDSLMSTAYLSFYLEWMYANVTPKIIRTITDAGLPYEHIEQVIPDARQYNHIYVINTQVQISLIKSYSEIHVPMTIISNKNFDTQWQEQYQQMIQTHIKETSYSARAHVVHPAQRDESWGHRLAYFALHVLTETLPIDVCDYAGTSLVHALTYPDFVYDDNEDNQGSHAASQYLSQESVKEALATALDKSDVMALKQIIADYTWWFYQAEKTFTYTEDSKEGITQS